MNVRKICYVDSNMFKLKQTNYVILLEVGLVILKKCALQFI